MLNLYDRNGIIIQALSRELLLGSRTVITTTGVSTYTPPTNCKMILVEAIGGGGGGSAATASTAGNIVDGSGGCGAAYANTLYGIVPGRTFTATVNAGGTSGATGGQTTLVDNVNGTVVVTAVGGNQGTQIANGNTEVFFAGGSSSVGTQTGDFIPGATQAPMNHRVSGTVAINGKGGYGPFGGQPVARITQGNGANGGNYGSGGSGGMSINAGGTATGGHGAQGVIIVWEFF